MRKAHSNPMGLSQWKSRLSIAKILLFSLSVVSLLIGAGGATAHYLGWSWGNRAHPIGWLLSMLFLLLAFAPSPRESARWLKSLIRPSTAFLLFWILFFVVSHLWNFRTAPWNADALFDESGNDLGYLKSHVIGHPYQAAWFHGIISRETLFHYYVWGFLKLFGFNILAYEAALFVIWLTAFVFTLLLVDLFFGSYIVTSDTALIFNFLPFAFIYTFVGYRYPMTVALAVVSLYFLHVGFKNGSPFCRSLGGIAAGLCLASSIPGKQYILALVIWAIVYAGLHWRSFKQSGPWISVLTVAFGFLVAATPIICYIIFNREHYTYYEGAYLHRFWDAVRGTTASNGMRYYVTGLWNCFFAAQYWPRLLFPDFLPIPLAYYWFLVPGVVLAVWEKRYEVVLLATLPVV